MVEQVSSFLHWHLKIFKALGFCFENIGSDNVNRKRWSFLWPCFLMIAFNVVVLMSLCNSEVVFFANDSFGFFNDVLKVVAADIAVTISYMESILKRSSCHKFWSIYCKLQEQKWEWTNWQEELRENCRFAIMFYTFIICEALVLLILAIAYPFQLFWSIYFPFIIVIHLRNMQVIFHVELIRLELLKLRDDLIRMADYSKFLAQGKGFRGLENFFHFKIVEKQRNYQMIYEMYEHFQNTFGFSICAVLLMIYVRILVDSYFGYYNVYHGSITFEIFVVTPAFMQIPMFLISSKCCMDVVKSITLNLHGIISQFNDQNIIISTQLQNFSLQILHQEIIINGIGISRMDGYMLTRVIGSITTYMIFFIQFMPKFSNV
uniref:Gustatory receptor n=1 Tax=Stomoxys calcitrans TaxID=35570 RepID=A0A1I8NXI6_STOCA